MFKSINSLKLISLITLCALKFRYASPAAPSVWNFDHKLDSEKVSCLNVLSDDWLDCGIYWILCCTLLPYHNKKLSTEASFFLFWLAAPSSGLLDTPSITFALSSFLLSLWTWVLTALLFFLTATYKLKVEQLLSLQYFILLMRFLLYVQHAIYTIFRSSK